MLWAAEQRFNQSQFKKKKMWFLRMGRLTVTEQQIKPKIFRSNLSNGQKD
jgi:hypothetical protein